MLFFVSAAFADPAAVLRAEGCLACHDLGEARHVGPPLHGVLGRTEVVLRDGVPQTVTVDPRHILRALTNPDADVVEGYPAGLMPALDPERAVAVAENLVQLGSDAPERLPAWWTVAAGALFCFGHLGLSAVRARLIRAMGELPYMGLYSVVVGLAFGAMLWAWSRAAYVELWTPWAWTRWIPFLLMPLVAILQVAGYSTPSPTLAGSKVELADGPRGIHRVTRHPVNISTAIWGLAHLLPNGDLASIGLFGSLIGLGILGSHHIDRRRAAEHGEAWARWAESSSVWPFVAILRGKNRLDLHEIGPGRILGGLVLFGGLLTLHTWIVGAVPYPWE